MYFNQRGNCKDRGRDRDRDRKRERERERERESQIWPTDKEKYIVYISSA